MQTTLYFLTAQLTHILIHQRAVIRVAVIVSILLISFVMTGVVLADGPATGGSTCGSC